MTLEELRVQINQLSEGERFALYVYVAETVPALASIKTLSDDGVERYRYLEARPGGWRKQLYIKGRKLLASIVWGDTIANKLSLAEAANNWDLPIEAIQEAIAYCESHRSLLELEAESERRLLETAGISLEPQAIG
ncbi:hypothetical protein [Synechococcus sp. PCC 7336]|uniref:hypothetical protein n=1 Tax=Synechococcus sp. PCC 7336 TaxID=195250 RepID=UPI0003467BD0|nr:hypothetical protein [Synechococcus sp. PCC 7336]